MHKRIITSRRSGSGILTLLLLLLATGPALAAQGQDEGGKHLFILSGQSNMRSPLPDAFRSCVEAVFGGDKVIVVPLAYPSQPIKKWYKDWAPPAGMNDEKPEENGNIYDKLLVKVRGFVKEAPLATVTYVWMQGEADAGSGWGSVYEKSFLGVLEQFKADLDIEEINFVVGRINDFWVDPEKHPDGERIREIQVKLGEKHANGAWINTDDLNRGVNPWGGYSLCDGHFPPPGYRIMGQRFAKAACKLIDPKMELDPAIFHEAFYDMAEDVKSHAAIGKPVFTGPNDKSGGKNPDLALLTDGKFGSSDPKDEAWLRIAPGEVPIVMILDLGEVQQVDAIGLHTLFSPATKAEFPKSFVFEFSEDGGKYDIGSSRYNTVKLNKYDRPAFAKTGNATERLLLLNEQTKWKAPRPGVQARYIRFTIQTGDQWVLIDELIVNPAQVAQN